MAAIRGSGVSPRHLSHRLAASIIFSRNGSLRCALLPEKKILPAALPDIVETSGVGLLHSLQGLRTGCFVERSRADRRELPSSGIET